MKFWSIITLMVFLNFTTLPSIAALVGWDLPQSNVVLNEEEPHNNSIVIYEKVIPKAFCIFDFLKFNDTNLNHQKIVENEFFSYFSPHLNIFSPPPEA